VERPGLGEITWGMGKWAMRKDFFFFFRSLLEIFRPRFLDLSSHDDGANGTLGLVMVFSLTVHTEMARYPSSWTSKERKGFLRYYTP
jgi:hypothetical protein